MALVGVFALALSSCSGNDGAVTGSSEISDGRVPSSLAMGITVRTKADVFGFQSGLEIEGLLIQDSVDPEAGDPSQSERGRPLSEAERSEIERLASDIAPVRWVASATAAKSQDAQTGARLAVVSVGEVSYDDDGALVPLSVWCGQGCGVWGTYRVQSVEPQQWVVTGSVEEIFP